MATFFKTNRSPSLTYTFTVDGTPFDLTDSTVKFMMRLETSSTLKVDAAATIVQSAPTVDTGKVRYDWASGDVDTAGEYVGWFRATLPSGKTQDTPEFEVVFLDHTPAATTSLLTTLQAARQYVLRSADDQTQDAKLAQLNASFSKAIYGYTRRQWHPEGTTGTHRFRYDGSGYLSLDPYDLRSVGTVTMWADQPTTDQEILDPGSGTVVAEYYLGPPDRTSEGTYTWIDLPRVYCPPRRGIQVAISGDWGISTVPDDVELACLVAIKAAYMNPEGYSSRSIGEVAFTEEFVATDDTSGRSLPQASRNLLIPYRRGKVVFA